MTWGHNDRRLFVATGAHVHAAWVSRYVSFDSPLESTFFFFSLFIHFVLLLLIKLISG